MKFIETQQQLEKIITKFQDIIGNEAQELNTSLRLQTSDKNLEAIQKLEEENRLLQIGIIGRVKAGKSSLLNALIFGGKSVLPKAATPMTAALTILSYGEKLSAEVDFFTSNDINNIKNEHSKYEREKIRLFGLHKEQLTETKKQKVKKEDKTKFSKSYELTTEEKNEIIEKAEKAAINDLKNQISLVSSFEQYEKIKASGISIEELQSKKSEIDANSYSDLGEKLLDYVGANGKYMPFTKSVHIKLPNENLRDIQIVDTPGVNDPVQSREERTRELLKYCDVILIVSPSGQFLSSEDTELMDRITSKEGVRELFVLASQVDNQLSGSIKRDSNGDLHCALNLVTSQLSEHMHATLSKLRSDSPEVGTAYDQLIESSKDKIIHSSSISQTIASFWDKREEWDSGTNTAWNNLLKHYPDYFSDSDKQLSFSNLEKLANIAEVHSVIDNVRSQKDSILAKRKDEFLSAKMSTLIEYKKALAEFIDTRLQDINSTDIKELEKTRNELQKVKTVASVYLDEKYSMLVSNLKLELKESLTKTLDSFFKEANKEISNAEDSKTETWEVSDSKWYNPLSWGSSHTASRTYATVRTGAVRGAIEALTSNIEDTIGIKSERIINGWRESTPSQLINTIRSQVDDEYLEIHRIIQAVRKVFNQIIYPEIMYSGKLPDTLAAKGKLTESSAEEFLANAQSYVANLKTRVKTDITQFLSKLIKELGEVNLSKEFFSNYDAILKELEEQITNKEITIDTFNRLASELKGVN